MTDPLLTPDELTELEHDVVQADRDNCPEVQIDLDVAKTLIDTARRALSGEGEIATLRAEVADLKDDIASRPPRFVGCEPACPGCEILDAARLRHLGIIEGLRAEVERLTGELATEAAAFKRVVWLESEVERLKAGHDAVAQLLERNGCDCECGHVAEDHDDDCERCFACEIDMALRTSKGATG